MVSLHVDQQKVMKLWLQIKVKASLWLAKHRILT